MTIWCREEYEEESMLIESEDEEYDADDIQDEQYKKIHWKHRNESALVIHRLGVHPEFQGHGLGKKMCHFAEAFAKENISIMWCSYVT